MTRKTFAICYAVAGICFAISGAAGFVAGRTGYAVIRLVLGAAMIFLSVLNIRYYRNEMSAAREDSAEDKGE